MYNLLSVNYRITAASKANRAKLTQVETSYVRPEQGYFIPTLSDFEWAWELADLIPAPFPNPNLGLSSNPDRIKKKDGSPEPPVDSTQKQMIRGRLKTPQTKIKRRKTMK